MKEELNLSSMDTIKSLFLKAEHFYQQNKPLEGSALVWDILTMSKRQNAAIPYIHRRVISFSLYLTCRWDCATACELGKTYSQCFQNSRDAEDDSFFWYYATALSRKGRTREALAQYERCRDLSAESRWLGAKAGRICAANALSLRDSQSDVDFLRSFLEKAEAGVYEDMDDTVEVECAVARLFLLNAYQRRHELRFFQADARRFLDYCNSVKDTTRMPGLTVRKAESLMGACLYEAGSYVEAAAHTEAARRVIPPNGLPIEPSDLTLCIHLLQCYLELKDREQVLRLVKELEGHLEAYQEDPIVVQTALTLLTRASQLLGQEDGISKDLTFLEPLFQTENLNYLDLLCRVVLSGQLQSQPPAVNTSFMVMVLDHLENVLNGWELGQERLEKYHSMLSWFLTHSDSCPCSVAQSVSILLMQAKVEWQMDHPDTLKTLSAVLTFREACPASDMQLSILSFAAVVYHNYGMLEQAQQSITQALDQITDAWRRATAYLNDHKICQLLGLIPYHLNSCYAIARTNQEDRQLYELVLRYKALPDLVGRERNQHLKAAPVDEELRQKIFSLQDRLAAAQLDSSCRDAASLQALQLELQAAEADFAEKFPESQSFIPISFDLLQETIPRGSAILEYYGAEDTQELDLFITANREGSVTLHRVILTDAAALFKSVHALEALMQAPDSILRGMEQRQLCTDLYRRLIQPGLPWLEGILQLYIAPDTRLFNLPFELLQPEDGPMLQDRYQLCRLVCGRDLLFFGEDETPEGSRFVLGAPNYDSVQGTPSGDSHLRESIPLTPVLPLPYSGVEAKRVGRQCGCQVLIGDAATKFSLRDALPSRIIHLATHGVFDQSMATDSLYSSYLVFAGYNRWVQDHVQTGLCGNGVLTADEISRMDLERTELVVLSACQSGLWGQTSLQGLVSAFSAAGVRWVVCHMWQASDIAAPIFMDAFYEAYLQDHMQVPQALQHAKQYLREVTVGQLRRKGWLSPDSPFGYGDEVGLSQRKDHTKPFHNVMYWGGFVCYRCR